MAIEPLKVELVPEDDDLRQSIDEAQKELDEMTAKAKTAQAEAKKAQAEQSKIGKTPHRRTSDWAGMKSRGSPKMAKGNLLSFQSPIAGAIGGAGKVFIFTHAANKVLRVGINIEERFKTNRALGRSDGETARELGGEAAESALRAVSSITGLGELSSIVAERLVGKEAAAKASKQFFDSVFKTTEELKRMIEEKERAIAESTEEMNESIAEAFGRLDSQLPTTFKFKRSKELSQYRRILKSKNKAEADRLMAANKEKAKELHNNEGT